MLVGPPTLRGPPQSVPFPQGAALLDTLRTLQGPPSNPTPMPPPCRQQRFLDTLHALVDMEARTGSAHPHLAALAREGMAALVEGRWEAWRARFLAEQAMLGE